MRIPFISTRRSSYSTERRVHSESEVTTFTGHPGVNLNFVNISASTRSLERRKGGGGRGRGSSSGSSSTSSKSLGKPRKVSLGGERLPNNKKTATSYGAGGGRALAIPFGKPFAGRIAGGGNRQGVYGNSIYGSGYPGVLASRGVAGRGFPYYFWPVVWYGSGDDSSAYLYDSSEYGLPDNKSRPGGPLETAQFHSVNTSSTFSVIADQSTVSSLLGSVKANCSSLLSKTNTSSSPTPYTNQSTVPVPEEALQYYRASTVVLTLDGYDSGALNDTQNSNASTPVVSLPNGTDMALLTCLNDTIGRAVPLIDAGARSGPPAVYTLLFAWLLVEAVRSMF